MADFSALKTSIQNYIKQNGNEEITGNLLQQVLLSMVTTLGDSAINDLVTALGNEVTARQNAVGTLENADTSLSGRINTLKGTVDGIIDDIKNGYVYAGIATPSTTPASGKVFYLALTAGTYTNFGATVVPQGINILKYNGSAWSLDSFLGLDDAPTQGSSNFVKSGGVLDSIIKDGSSFDLSAYNNGTTYADLSAALTALNALPAAYKKGGMSMKYVQSSDNKYIQARCMAQNFTTDVTQWQVVDVSPTDNSHNLVESGGVKKELTLLKDNFGGVNLEEIIFIEGKYIDTSGTSVPTENGEIVYTDRSAERCAAIEVSAGDVFLLNNSSNNSKWRAYGWAKSDFTFIDKTVGTYTCVEEVVVAPANAAWLILNDVNPNAGKYCYKGKNIQVQIDEKIALIAPSVTDAQNETKDLKIGQNHYLLSSDMASKRLITEIPVVNGTGAVSTSATSNINIISSTNVFTIKKGSILRIVTTGFGDYITKAVLVINDTIFVEYDTEELLYTTDVDITTVRVYVNPTNISANGDVSTVISLPCVYENMSILHSIITNEIDFATTKVTNAENEVKDLEIKGQHYLLSSDTASKRLVTELSLASGTGTVNTTASSNINIIRSNTPVTTVKKGSTIKVVTTGMGDIIKQITLLLNGNKYISIVDAELLYTTDVDITTVRAYVSPRNVIVNGNVSVTITLPSVYENIGFETNKTAVIPELKLKRQESDVYGNILISPIWRQITVDGNLKEEASSEYITCDSIPVDNIAFLRITSEYDYVVFFLNSNKQKITYNLYSGNQVLVLNDYIKNSDIKYIRIRVHTANSANIILRCDTIISRYNNKRLLGNKNVKCFAHRGSSLLSTEASGDNYPTSIWGSYINGFDGVHVNIQFTTDHVPYCLHDTTFIDDTTQQTITLCDCTSAQIDTYTRNGLPIAKVESAIYMAKMLGLDVIIYNIYGTQSNDNYDALINIVKKYNMFEHIWFGLDGHPSTPNTDYLSKLVAACPKVNILRTQYPLTDTNYSVITDLIADANTLLQSYPQLNIALWVTPTHIEQHFIDANLAKPYNVKLAAFSVTLEDIEKVMPYVDFMSTDRGTWSFGAERRDIEKIVTDKYPEFLLGNFGNVI